MLYLFATRRAKLFVRRAMCITIRLPQGICMKLNHTILVLRLVSCCAGPLCMPRGACRTSSALLAAVLLVHTGAPRDVHRA